jgi:hydroxyacylglutathione hydrolase
MINVIPFESRYFSLRSYILADYDAGECLVIDPAREISSYIENPLKIKAVINTHIHFDHTLGNPFFSGLCPIKAHKLENKTLYRLMNTFISSVIAGKKPPKTDFILTEDIKINIGETTVRILHTPGHSPGSICLYWDGNLISGDTIFTGGIGRTDIPHGSSTSMKESLKILLDLPDDTLIWPGHVYGSKYPVTMKENRRTVVWFMNSL